jgi:signal transduction histidine kinase
MNPRNWTIRGRLTALYAGLFFVAGAVLLALTYLLVWQILNRNGQPLPDTGELRRALSQTGSIPLGPNGESIRVDELYNVVRNAQAQVRTDVLNSLLTQGVVALVVTGLIAAALGWLLAGRALSPVQRITETARRIAGTDGAGRGLHERISLAGPRNEVTELAETFNAMLERLDRSFEGQHKFITNASHEMRTPLAVKRALIEITVSRAGTSTDAKELGEALLDINARHERLIDGLLTLADSENELTERSPVDLADVAEHVLHQLSSPARENQVEIRPSVLTAAPVVGDPVLLERLTQNLVENAIRHNNPGGWLSVKTSTAAGRSMVTVSNTGAVVRPYEVEILFQPFRRLDRERTAGERGFGLGLSIARAISRAHGGEITATPRPEGGLDMTVTLPA